MKGSDIPCGALVASPAAAHARAVLGTDKASGGAVKTRPCPLTFSWKLYGKLPLPITWPSTPIPRCPPTSPRSSRTLRPRPRETTRFRSSAGPPRGRRKAIRRTSSVSRLQTQVSSATSLRRQYTLPGTDFAYGAPDGSDSCAPSAQTVAAVAQSNDFPPGVTVGPLQPLPSDPTIAYVDVTWSPRCEATSLSVTKKEDPVCRITDTVLDTACLTCISLTAEQLDSSQLETRC